MNLKAEKVFFKVLSRFNEIFTAEEAKNEFLGLKRLKNSFRSKKPVLKSKKSEKTRC